ncbi:hypothetical protein GCM10023185_15190 [Hymenobacter saemangeumensis]|uniref:Lipoprotein n=1 Tax=Hymenobacter saemangeumensis TaxID=1084522 RepID=A0ABP8I961_9BACT
MSTHGRAVFLFLALLSGLGACARAPYQYQPLASSPATAPGSQALAPQLLFVSFKMSSLPPGPRRIELLKALAVAGEANAQPEDVAGPAYLLLTQLDAAGKPQGPGQRLPHPLQLHLEVPAEGSSGRLERHEATLPEAEFFVRLARQPQAVSIRVEEVNPAAPAPVSATFPLHL